MNSFFFPSSLLPLFPSCKSSSPSLQPKPQYICTFNRHHHDHNLPILSHSLKPSLQLSLSTRKTSVGAASPPDEGAVSVINFEDFTEKDWSFLDSDELNFKEHIQRIDHIISAGEIDESSRVLVSISSEEFVDRLVESLPSLLLVVHDSLFVLAGIKEKYDMVKCWQGELIYVPEKWAPLDVVFLYFLPAMPFPLDQVFETLAKRCSPGTLSEQVPVGC